MMAEVAGGYGGRRPEPEEYKRGALRIDAGKRKVWFEDRPIGLTRSEFWLLLTLARANGNVVSTVALVEAIHDDSDEYSSITIKRHMSEVRRKLAEAGAAPGCIRTVRGEGYSLEEDCMPRQ